MASMILTVSMVSTMSIIVMVLTVLTVSTVMASTVLMVLTLYHCNGVDSVLLEPIPANPSRVGTRISPKIQTNTRTTKWRQGTAITQLINSPSKPGDESGSTSTSNTIGCKPHKYSRACSHPLSTIIHNLQLA